MFAGCCAHVHMYTSVHKVCDWRREMRNLFLCSGSTEVLLVGLQKGREGNGTVKGTEKTKDSGSLSERTLWLPHDVHCTGVYYTFVKFTYLCFCAKGL